jgi:peptidoglycan/xylan/chitin deacetylase (PgdA/CDA1 family)
MKNSLTHCLLVGLLLCLYGFDSPKPVNSWIRINQLGYLPGGQKTAVWCSKDKTPIRAFELVNAKTNLPVFKAAVGLLYGAYGPFQQTARLDFTAFQHSGKYYLRAGNAASPVFEIGEDVYEGTADFCLRYMRQQRSGYNPFLQDSCHTHDGYVLYGAKAGLVDSSFMDVSGGWHDASDYLQYGTTSANAAYHLLMAYRDFPEVFGDEKKSNGTSGSNGLADVLDEARWGLDWLLKMHPAPNILFNQLGDDRDHMGMRIPKEDTYYDRGFERPVYLVTGEPQQRGKFMNDTKGTSSTAAKYAASFALGSRLFAKTDSTYAKLLREKSLTALRYSNIQPGVTQTASVRSPYIYAEDNWTDDMELAYTAVQSDKSHLDSAFWYAQQEKITPWLGKDTAKHYQWYPFINVGHYELAKQVKGAQRDSLIQFYQRGIEAVWQKAKQNAFFRGIPFIWCSNNLTVAFAQQCMWYRQLTNNKQYLALEQANIDWLFGCNPWGTSMVYGLPWWGDTPVDPHSAFTHIKNYAIDGGLVDGPVYTNIYKGLIGIQLQDVDEYAEFQSDLAVYHDDYGDYSTNEPTMDGTASLIYLLAAKEQEVNVAAHRNCGRFANTAANYLPFEQQTVRPAAANPFGKQLFVSHGAVVKAKNRYHKQVALVFTGDEYAEGLPFIRKTLKDQQVKAGFFFTGRMYRNTQYKKEIQQLYKDKHYMGPHSDGHLLYCDWQKRDSLLVSWSTFSDDWNKNLYAIEELGIPAKQVKYFIPPYEWWNDSVATWTSWKGAQLFSFTPGVRTNADYTWPQMGNRYVSNKTIMASVNQQLSSADGLDGYILLIHVGTDPRRKEKLYHELPALIKTLRKKGYQLVPIDALLR